MSSQFDLANVYPRLRALGDFVRTPTLGRSLAGLLTAGFLLLLFVNLTTLVMLNRTTDAMDAAARAGVTRSLASEVLVEALNAETGQRGYLLTLRDEYLEPYGEATRRLPERIQQLRDATRDDAELAARVERLDALSSQRMAVIDRTLYLARIGRVQEGAAVLRNGQGKFYMDEMRRLAGEIDAIQDQRVDFRTQQMRWAARATGIVNGVAGLLIILVAVVVAILVRRYIGEIQSAKVALDHVNAGLEDRIRERTADLSRANEEIQRFAYIVSHDLRAPLVNVMGYTSELEQAGRIVDEAIVKAEAERDVDPEVISAIREDMPEAIGFIRASTGKMDRLINAILRLSREGRRTLTPEMLDMSKMVQTIADSVRHQVEEQGAEIVVERLPRIESDRLFVEQVFGNLIDNAVKYLEPSRPGRIVVSGVEEPGGQRVYRITDNGRGISDRDHERIFELFRRSGRQDRPGEGLGLAFVRNALRRLGATIDVESELGKGSTFILTFPTRLVLQDTGDSV